MLSQKINFTWWKFDFPSWIFSNAIWRKIEFLNFFRVMNFEYFYKLWNVAFYVEKISLVRLWEFYHSQNFKVGCVFAMAVVSILSLAEFGRNDHREDAPHFSKWIDMANKWREINIFSLLIEYEIRFFTIIPHVNTRSALIFSFDRI